MRVYKTKECARLARKAGLRDRDLLDAVRRAEQGTIDGVIGRFLIKQRLASGSRGKAKGHRTIIVFVRGDRAVFLHLFSKNEKGNLTVQEEFEYRDAAKVIAGLPESVISTLVSESKWIEIEHEPFQDIPK